MLIMVQAHTGIWSSILKQASKLSGDHSASERRAEAALLVQAVSAAALLRRK